MITDQIEINQYVVLIEQSSAETTVVEKCGFKEDMIGFAFYGSGDVELDILYGNKKRTFNNTKGAAMSFFGNSKVEFAHKIAPERPLQCITVFSKINQLASFSEQENEVFTTHLQELIHPKDDFVEGPAFYMIPDMQNAVHKILTTHYTGPTRALFLKSQITELISHFFGLLAMPEEDTLKLRDKEKLHYAKEILSSKMDTPPSLEELSKLVGLNSHKLKKDFKELFGTPVFKYLQNERLNKAHDLLRNSDLGIQEAAWAVGYESLSSFSNAFTEKFGFRPSELKK